MICLMENETLVQSKECFDKEQIGVKEPFLMTNCKFTSQVLGTFGVKEQFQGDQKVPYHQVRIYVLYALYQILHLNSPISCMDLELL